MPTLETPSPALTGPTERKPFLATPLTDEERAEHQKVSADVIDVMDALPAESLNAIPEVALLGFGHAMMALRYEATIDLQNTQNAALCEAAKLLLNALTSHLHIYEVSGLGIDENGEPDALLIALKMLSADAKPLAAIVSLCGKHSGDAA